MRVSIVVAMSLNRVIGCADKLPWHLPEDLKHFRRLTIGKPVVMGRRTLQSIGKPLKGRFNIVLSRDVRFAAEGCVVAHSIDEAVSIAKEHVNADDELMVIGGGEVYRQFISRCDRMYITRVETRVSVTKGLVRFPLGWEQGWRYDEASRVHYSPDVHHQFAFDTIVCERTRATSTLPNEAVDRPSLAAGF